MAEAESISSAKFSVSEEENRKQLFPVFLELEELRLLLVGGGNAALEKLQSVLRNSPRTQLALVAPVVLPEIIELAKEFSNLVVYEREFDPLDCAEADLVFIAIDDAFLANEITQEAHKQNLLVHVAGAPELCDFYLIPEKTSELHARNGIASQEKTTPGKTAQIFIDKEESKRRFNKRLRYAFVYSISVLAIMITGHLLFSILPLEQIGTGIASVFSSVDKMILLWILGGFIAQMIDGALGMAYGVSASTFLLSFGIPPAVTSASMHASEIFTTGTSSLFYIRYKNINFKLFKNLFVPGAIGAIAGACTLSLLKGYMFYVKPLVAAYTLILGVLIIRKALVHRIGRKKKFNRIWPLAAAGGFLDAAGGGGWGPIVTSTLVAGGRDLRYTIGSAHAARFFVALMATITYFCLIGISHWQIIAGLVIGAAIAAPISVKLSTKISVRNGLILVGFLVIIVSLKTIIGTFL